MPQSPEIQLATLLGDIIAMAEEQPEPPKDPEWGISTDRPIRPHRASKAQRRNIRLRWPAREGFGRIQMPQVVRGKTGLRY